MESVDTRKLFDDLGLTRSEERVLRHVAGLRYTEPRGRIERVFYSPLRPSLDVLVALIVIAILVVGSFYVAWRFADFFKAASLPVLGVTIVVVLAKRDRLVKKLYRALEAERAWRARASTGGESRRGAANPGN